MDESIKRKRYCDIISTDLPGILSTCNRHIKNINLTQSDLLNEGDGTSTDFFYIDMFRDTWTDLKDDLEVIMKAQGMETSKLTYEEWSAELDVIALKNGYEKSSTKAHFDFIWKPLYEQGFSPRQAWNRV